MLAFMTSPGTLSVRDRCRCGALKKRMLLSWYILGKCHVTDAKMTYSAHWNFKNSLFNLNGNLVYQDNPCDIGNVVI